MPSTRTFLQERSLVSFSTSNNYIKGQSCRKFLGNTVDTERYSLYTKQTGTPTTILSIIVPEVIQSLRSLNDQSYVGLVVMIYAFSFYWPDNIHLLKSLRIRHKRFWTRMSVKAISGPSVKEFAQCLTPFLADWILASWLTFHWIELPKSIKEKKSRAHHIRVVNRENEWSLFLRSSYI